MRSRRRSVAEGAAGGIDSGFEGGVGEEREGGAYRKLLRRGEP